MQIILAPLFSFLARIVGKFFTDQGLKFVAYKSLLVTLLTVTFPVMCKSLLMWLFKGLIGIAGGVQGIDDLCSVSVQLTGLTGWIASNMMLPECIAIILTGCAIRLALNFIPFIG